MLIIKLKRYKIIDPPDLTFRPIVAGPSCPTHRLSNLIDILLQPFLKNIRSLVRDDIDFLSKIPENIYDNSTLTTFDVSSLYSNIPHELGKEAISYWIQKHSDNLHPRFNKEFVIEAIDLILNNNTFQFDNQHYIQTLGTAMGTKMAPNYATLTLGYLEISLYEKVGYIFGSHFEELLQQSWKRYLDDCFIIWNNSWGDITTLHEILQNVHPNIKLTVETSKKEIPFLDILIIKNGCKIITDIYRKPTDTQQYLHFKSHHPKTCRTSIPYTLARRICTIIVPSALRNIRLNELRNVLKERGYPITLINKGIELANSLPLNILRQAKVKDSKQPLAFVSTFNRRNPELFTEAYNHLNNLRMDDKLNDILNNTKVIKSKRQPNNLKQILTHAKFSQTNNDENYEVKKCNDRRCKVCEILIEGKIFKFKNCQTEFEVKRNFTCNSKNVVYVIQCDSCKEEYIGSTQQLNHRVALHKSNIKFLKIEYCLFQNIFMNVVMVISISCLCINQIITRF